MRTVMNTLLLRLAACGDLRQVQMVHVVDGPGDIPQRLGVGPVM